MDEEIVADTGPLIALAKLRRLSLLSEIVERVLVPQVVANEFMAKAGIETAEFRAAMGKFLEITSVPPSLARPPVLGRMHAGEIEAMTLAKSRGLRLLIDEREGRKIAKDWDIEVVGVVAILVQLKQEGLIQLVGPDLLLLRDHGYRISQSLMETALRLASE